MFGAFRKVRWSWRASAVLLGFVVLGGSVAIADIPDGNTINTCRNTTTGALRVIDRDKGGQCSAGEALLSWNRWRWRKAFSSSVGYHVADVVSYQGSSYIAWVRPPVGIRPTNNSFWGLVASKGAIGLPGLPGLSGLAGATGLPGVVGATGAQGAPGLVGETGPQGVQGLPGATGPQGIQGSQGLTGGTGPQGVQGLTGATGPQGIQGVQGPTGIGADPIFAKINSNGSVAYGSHVTSASVLANTYTINFDQNVSQCAVNTISEQAVAIPVITGRGPTSISLNFTLPTAIPALTANTFDVTVVC